LPSAPTTRCFGRLQLPHHRLQLGHQAGDLPPHRVRLTGLNEREAFKAMFAFREPLEHLNPREVANLDKAIANAEAFTKEVIDSLRKEQAAKSKAAA
jgi:hypothetical protein